MVPLVRVGDAFEAKVLAARLGADGFVTELRGGGIDGTYPFGAVEVLVAEGDLEAAQELLLVDEVESAFEDDGEPASSPSGWRRWAPPVVLGVLALTVLARVLNFAA